MLREDLFYKIVRYKKSYDFIYSDETIKKYKFSEYRARTKNNMIDVLQLVQINAYGKEKVIFRCNLQTIANHPKFYFRDTIKEGGFQLKMFVDRRKYKTDIHGIINAYDLDNQLINNKSTQWDKDHWKGRFLRHAKGKYKFAYSGACFVSSDEDMKEENKVLRNVNVKRHDIINGILIEIETTI